MYIKCIPKYYTYVYTRIILYNLLTLYFYALLLIYNITYLLYEYNNSSRKMSENMCQNSVSSCASLSSASKALNFGVIKIRVLIHALIKHYILYTARTTPDFPIARQSWWWDHLQG